MIAEESTLFGSITKPLEEEGLGFDYRWNFEFMNKSFEFFGCDPLFRKGIYNEFLNSMIYAYTEHYVLPFSHDEVVHGIPRKDHILKEGDIVSLDAGLIYKGYHSDAARTHGVGKISQEAQDLIDRTKQSFFEGIKMATANNHLYDISRAIDQYISQFGYGVVRDLVGHGIGTALHEDPQIPNFTQRRRGIKLKAGMTLAIEPMVNVGTHEVRVMKDGWTVVTADDKLSAHYENTVLITDGEPEILTVAEGL